MAPPFIFTVAPRGIIIDALDSLTPSLLLATLKVVGIVALLLLVEKAMIWKVKALWIKCKGLTLATIIKAIIKTKYCNRKPTVVVNTKLPNAIKTSKPRVPTVLAIKANTAMGAILIINSMVL